MKLLFLTNVPSPYRVDFFNELGKHCDLTVTFEKRTSDERDASWKKYRFDKFKGVFLKGKSINTDTAICFDVIKYVRDKCFDKIICANFTSPTGMIAIRYMKIHHIKYWLESDGGFAKSGKGFKEKLKKYLISGAEGYFSTGKEHDKYYTTYGADPQKIHRYPFTSLRESDILNEVPTQCEKMQLRRKLGMTEDKIVISVGRFIPQKGFDVLLRAMSNMSKSIGVYLVGGVPSEEYLRIQKNNNLNNAHFIEFKSKDELAKYYKAADVFVLPSRGDIWGLVINEAMAYGLPVITTNKCGAGLELVKDGKNGYIVPVDDMNSLSAAIEKNIEDKEVCASFGAESLKIISKYTIEKMAEYHLQINPM